MIESNINKYSGFDQTPVLKERYGITKDSGNAYGFFKKNTQSTVKNCTNDRNDASLQMDHRAMFTVLVWSPSSHQGGYPASLPSPEGWRAKGGHHCSSTMPPEARRGEVICY